MSSSVLHWGDAMNVLVVDDHEIVRRGLTQILEGHHGLHVAGEASTSAEALEICRNERIDVAVVDISLPDRNGLELTKDIRTFSPDTRILVLSMYPEDQFAVRALRDGASGYLTKESAVEELLEAVMTIAAGRKYISEGVAEKLSDMVFHPDDLPAHQRLSDREFEVLRLIASGKTSKEIAGSLNLSVKTVSTYRTRLLEKLQLTSNAELTHYAFRYKLVD
jgi:two-component system invasion response regulator UvrY